MIVRESLKFSTTSVHSHDSLALPHLRRPKALVVPSSVSMLTTHLQNKHGRPTLGTECSLAMAKGLGLYSLAKSLEFSRECEWIYLLRSK